MNRLAASIVYLPNKTFWAKENWSIQEIDISNCEIEPDGIKIILRE